MANTVFICGKSGSGKTTAIRTLNPKETVIFKCIQRTLPFPTAKQYSEENKNLFFTPTFDRLQPALAWAMKRPNVKNVVITDGTYLMRNEFIDKINQIGYKKFNEMGEHTKRLFELAQNLREDQTVFIEWHPDTAESDGNIITYEPATVGKLVDKVSKPFENVDIILFAEPKYSNDTITYGFYTNRALGRGGIEIPAKTPMGMFSELFIPNDLQLVADTIKNYYGGDEGQSKNPTAETGGSEA